MLHTIFGKMRRHSGIARPKWALRLRSDGFSVIPASRFAEEVTVTWASVREVVAYKVDCYVHDEICLTIQIDQDAYITLTEEVPGYTEWLQAAEIHLPGMRTNWFSDVAHPPFARNLTVLFKRS